MTLFPAGIAYIVCPHDIDRSLYIKECFLNNRITIRMEDGSTHNQVIIPSSILNEITFPTTSKELGSAVAYITEYQQQKPMIVAHYPKADQLGEGRENAFQFNKKWQDKFISVDGDVEKGVLNVSVNGGDGGAKIIFDLDNDNDTGEFELGVAGSVLIRTTSKTTFENKEEFRSVVASSIESEDEEETQEQSVISQTSQKIIVSGANVVINGKDIEVIHQKGYRIIINDDGIEIDALDKAVTIRSGENTVEIDEDGVDIEAKAVNLAGGFEALYNKIPGAPLANIKQIGVSKKVKIG